MLKVVSIHELDEIFKQSNIVDNEVVDLIDAGGRILAEDITAPFNLPGFNRSSVDGYAVKSEDTYLCSESNPAVLKNLGIIKIGKKPPKDIEGGKCIYIPTGGMLPTGSDAVAMIEDCEELEGEVLVNKNLHKYENVVFKDDDVKEGETVIYSGTRLNSSHIGILAGLGITKVKVRRRIKAGVISTGDELVSPYGDRELPQVYDINGYYLYQGLKELGCSADYIGIVNDDEEKLFKTVEEALSRCDIVLLSGGSSAGNKDFTINIMERLGKVLFHGIAIKPGKPTLMAKCEDKYIIGLPGHPLSCAVVFKFVISKLVHSMYGEDVVENYIEGIFDENYHKARGREEYLPVVVEDGIVKPVYAKSSAISIMAKADGFVNINRDVEGIQKGTKVKVLR